MNNLEISKYIVERTSSKVIVDKNVSFYLGNSTLESSFEEGKSMGLFTTNPISKYAVIMEIGDDCKMNDPMIDLRELFKADTSEKTFHAWKNMEASYYDIEKAEKVVNVRMLTDGKTSYYEAIKDIPANTELVRMYAFSTWTLELLNLITNKNVVGFAQFINELSFYLKGDPFENRIKTLNDVLYNLGIKDIFTIDRNEYDESMKDTKTISLSKLIINNFKMHEFAKSLRNLTS